MAQTFGLHDANIDIAHPDAEAVTRYTELSVLCRRGAITIRTHAGALVRTADGVATAERTTRPFKWVVTLDDGEVWTITKAERRCMSCS